ncbi:MAG: TolB family protein [Chloroflexota bacterium]
MMQNRCPSGARRRLAVSLGVSVLAIMLAAPTAGAATPKTRLVSKSSAKIQGDKASLVADISGTGQFVAFDSRATNLIRGDDNNSSDVFIRDSKTGKTRLVSKSFVAGVASGKSSRPSISVSGRYIAFQSDASDLTRRDANDKVDVFVWDRKRNGSELISRNKDGAQGDDHSFNPAISANGRWVAFESSATNLVGEDNKGNRQIYLFDRSTHDMILVSRNGRGRAGNSDSRNPAITAKGHYVVYESAATNLTSKDSKGYTQVYKFDRVTMRTTLVSRNNKGKAGNNDSNDPAISTDDARVVFNSLATNFAKDTNGVADVYMRDRKAKRTRRVSLNWRGKQLNGGSQQVNTNPDISANGKWVAFESAATNATKRSTFSGAYEQLYARNLQTGLVKLISRRGPIANASSNEPTFSDDGAFAAFTSQGTNLIAGGDVNGDDEDVFRRGPID